METEVRPLVRELLRYEPDAAGLTAQFELAQQPTR